MGRYYNGDINGKFWFGIQSSDDALYFGAVEHREYGFHGCECTVEHPTETSYCEECFESYEEHQNAIQEEGIEDVSQMWYERAGARYELTDIDIVRDKISKLEKMVGHLISSYKLDENLEYEVEFECWDDMTKIDQELLARLCLGRQILACMKVKEECSFYAEF